MTTRGARALATSDRGVYAILYAILIVVMVAMAGFALDLASARSDQRTDKSAADSAALAAGNYINFVNGDAVATNPQKACQAAWSYLHSIVPAITDLGSTACSAFPNTTASAAAICSAPTSATMPATTEVNGYTVQMEWPVPDAVNGSPNPFLHSDLDNGGANQPIVSAVDGTSSGCSRFGVAVAYHRVFGISNGIGVGGTTTLMHSVINVTVNPGNKPTTASLNVLNRTLLCALSTSGQGGAIVQRSTDGHPGVIAIESAGVQGSNCVNQNGSYAITMSTNGNNVICAAGVNATAGNCDGNGIIMSHALDGDPNNSCVTNGYCAYLPAATTTLFKNPNNFASPPKYELMPVPIPEGGVSGWAPVTAIYGCDSGTTSQCAPLSQNWIANLVSAYGGSSQPSTVYVGSTKNAAGSTVYTGPDYSATPWTVISGSACSSGDQYYVPGNYYVNCGTFTVKSRKVVFGGGNVVFAGNLQLQGGTGGGTGGDPSTSCLAFNVPEGAAGICPTKSTWVGTDTDQVTTSPAPKGPAIVFVRGSLAISQNTYTFAAPQTFLYQVATNGSMSVGGGGGDVLWTAPGAGPLDSDSNRPLAAQCWDSSLSPAAVDSDCMTSHFQKLAYWSALQTSYASSNGKPDVFDSLGGQGSNQFVGTFFTPRAQMQLSGQGSSTGASAQFWADSIVLGGQGAMNLIPNPSVNIERPSASVSLIR